MKSWKEGPDPIALFFACVVAFVLVLVGLFGGYEAAIGVIAWAASGLAALLLAVSVRSPHQNGWELMNGAIFAATLGPIGLGAVLFFRIPNILKERFAATE